MSETVVMALTEFLLARIAEDEAGARAAMKAGAKWVTAADTAGGVAGADAGLFILFHNPARVLAECEAKRRIVEAVDEIRCFHDVTDRDQGRLTLRDDILAALALPYADHPDFRDEWRP